MGLSLRTGFQCSFDQNLLFGHHVSQMICWMEFEAATVTMAYVHIELVWVGQRDRAAIHSLLFQGEKQRYLRFAASLSCAAKEENRVDR